jgi:hypothetical protein
LMDQQIHLVPYNILKDKMEKEAIDLLVY